MPECKEFTGIRAMRNEYALSYKMDEVYWPLHYAREIDADGNLEKFSTEEGPKRCLVEIFQEYVEKRLDLDKASFDTGSWSWHNLDWMSKHFQVCLTLTGSANAPWGRVLASFCERVTHAICEWNDHARKQEEEVVVWYTNRQNSQDPLDLASLDILL